MPPITAFLHTENDALRLGRALEMLLPCREILVVDHHSTDDTVRIAKQYGSRIVTADNNAQAKQFLSLARSEWILCLQPSESIDEALQTSLFEWNTLPAHAVAGSFAVFVREQSGQGWQQLPAPETRLVPRDWTRWHGRVPIHDSAATVLEGELLRFALP